MVTIFRALRDSECIDHGVECAAVEVARIFAAEPCAKPAKDGLGLLAGDQRCWAELFPEDEK